MFMYIKLLKESQGMNLGIVGMVTAFIIQADSLKKHTKYSVVMDEIL